MSSRRGDATTTQKKYPRSNSPRSVERRRIAQRNHRQRLKGTIHVATDDSSETQKGNGDAYEPEQASVDLNQALYQPPEDDTALDFTFVDPQLRPTSSPEPSSGNTMMEGYFMAGTLPPKQQHIPSWMGVDHMMMSMPAGTDALMSHQGATSYSIQASCTCNNVTGPCPGHLDKMRSELLAASASSSPMQQHMQQPQSHQPQSHQRHPSIVNVGMPYPQPVPQQYSTIRNNTHTSSLRRSAPSSTSSISLSSGSRSPSAARHSSLTEESMPSSMSSSMTPQSSSAPSLVGSTKESTPPKTAEGITARFKTILEATKAAGFPDFDRMVIAYYTAQFERSSMAGMAQRASRGRRLRSVVQELRHHSDSWSRWDSRELQESFLEAAKSQYIAEIEHLEKGQALDPIQIEAGDISTAFNWLFHSGYDEMEVEGSSETTSKLRQYLSLLSERGEVAQDSVPHLWSLLTELAGPHGLYCDRIAQVILAILLGEYAQVCFRF
ncbi:uncharacterized protein PG998_002983 [Apiospora kogelbergensis]|uniref:uncharacterized protein n=1 Tax=Apiospora kogelbergensis TaxID=1337665 RepID=UPI00312D366A